MQRVLIISIQDGKTVVGLWQPHRTPEWQLVEGVASSPRADGQIFEQIDRVLSAGYCRLEDITHIGVMAGPASYTQLRIIVSIANTLAWTKGIPLFALRPDDIVPDSLPERMQTAKRDIPIEPVYPSEIG